MSSPHNATGYYTVYGEEALHADHFSTRLSFGDTQTVWARTGYLGFLRRTELTDASGGTVYMRWKPNTLVSLFRIFLRWLFYWKLFSIKGWFAVHPDKFNSYIFYLVLIHFLLCAHISNESKNNQLCRPINQWCFAYYSRETRCLVCGWISGWDSRAAGNALPSHWYWNVCNKITQEHCRVVSNIFKMFSLYLIELGFNGSTFYVTVIILQQIVLILYL